MFPTKFQVSWHFGSGEEAKIRFSRWPPYGDHLGFTIRTVLLFFIYKSPRCFLPSFKSFGISVQKKKRKIYFQECRHNGPLGSRPPRRAILDIRPTRFQLLLIHKSPRCFLPIFKSIGHLIQEKKPKTDFEMAATVAILDF